MEKKYIWVDFTIHLNVPRNVDLYHPCLFTGQTSMDLFYGTERHRAMNLDANAIVKLNQQTLVHA